MANHPPPPPSEGLADDFLEQILSMPSSYGGGDDASLAAGMALHRSSGDGSSVAARGGGAFPLGLSLEQGSSTGKRLFEGQDTKMQRRERIAERLRALQELVPNTNRTDRAAMLDEILDYVKFLRLQVKWIFIVFIHQWQVLSMSRLGGAGAVAQLVADIPVSVEVKLELLINFSTSICLTWLHHILVKGETSEGGSTQHIWEKWSTDGTERQVAKLMEEDIGAAMQFLQSKSLCMMPISLAMAILDTNHQSESKTVKPEPNTPS
ncbi:hypothetical protein BHE74_00031663 [Ensete ventricosum]|nr:hypothetical protein BHE74_00031663 [Ensete ventricosum]